MNFLNEYIEKIGTAKVVGVIKNHEHNMSAKLLYALLLSKSCSCALVTNRLIYVNDDCLELSIQKNQNEILEDVINQAIDYCFVDISIEDIKQHAFDSQKFDGMVFTGLEKKSANKQLDISIQRDTVKSIIDQLPKESFVLTNLDDKNGKFILQNTHAKKYGYSQKSMAEFKVKILEKNHFGSRLNLDNEEVWVTTKHENECCEMLCTYAIASLLDLEKIDILVFLSSLTSKRGSIALELNKSFNVHQASQQ